MLSHQILDIFSYHFFKYNFCPIVSSDISNLQLSLSSESFSFQILYFNPLVVFSNSIFFLFFGDTPRILGCLILFYISLTLCIFFSTLFLSVFILIISIDLYSSLLILSFAISNLLWRFSNYFLFVGFRYFTWIFWFFVIISISLLIFSSLLSLWPSFPLSLKYIYNFCFEVLVC